MNKIFVWIGIFVAVLFFGFLGLVVFTGKDLFLGIFVGYVFPIAVIVSIILAIVSMVAGGGKHANITESDHHDNR